MTGLIDGTCKGSGTHAPTQKQVKPSNSLASHISQTTAVNNQTLGSLKGRMSKGSLQTFLLRTMLSIACVILGGLIIQHGLSKVNFPMAGIGVGFMLGGVWLMEP